MALVGCRVDTTVDITMNDEGQGGVSVTVLLDEDAAKSVGDLSQVLQLDDLEKAGWEIGGPDETADHGVIIVANHRFANVAQGQALVRSITGENGPLRDFTLRRTASNWKTTITSTGRLDLSSGIDSFDDPSLHALLGGADLADVTGSARDGAAVDPEAFRMSVRVDASGMKVADPATAAISANLGSEPEKLSYVGTKRHLNAYVLAGLAGLAVIVAIWLALFDYMPITRNTRMARRRRKRRRQHHSARHGWDIVEGRTGVETPAGHLNKPSKNGLRRARRHRRHHRGRKRPPSGPSRTLERPGTPGSSPPDDPTNGSRFPFDDWQPDL